MYPKKPAFSFKAFASGDAAGILARGRNHEEETQRRKNDIYGAAQKLQQCRWRYEQIVLEARVESIEIVTIKKEIDDITSAISALDGQRCMSLNLVGSSPLNVFEGIPDDDAFARELNNEIAKLERHLDELNSQPPAPSTPGRTSKKSDGKSAQISERDLLQISGWNSDDFNPKDSREDVTDDTFLHLLKMKPVGGLGMSKEEARLPTTNKLEALRLHYVQMGSDAAEPSKKVEPTIGICASLSGRGFRSEREVKRHFGSIVQNDNILNMSHTAQTPPRVQSKLESTSCATHCNFKSEPAANRTEPKSDLSHYYHVSWI